jgi:hypothetical protein
MAKKANNEPESPAKDSRAAQSQGKNGPTGEKLTNKTEAVQRALDELGPHAMPLAIQEFVKTRYGVDISNKVVSVYKRKLAKRGRRRGRPKGEVATPRAGGPGEVTIADLRTVRELSDRVGPRRLREVLDLLS